MEPSDAVPRLPASDLTSAIASAPEDFTAEIEALSAARLAGLIESSGLPSGSEQRISLYKIWLAGTVKRQADDANDIAFVWFNLGTEYSSRHSPSNRLCFQTALAIKPTFYQAAVNLGLIHEADGRIDLALEVWRRALGSVEGRPMLLNNLGRAQESLKRFRDARRSYIDSLSLDPDQPPVLHHLVGLRTKTCDWPVYATDVPGVSLADLKGATRALTLLALSDSNVVQQEGNASWIDEKMPVTAHHLSGRTRNRTGKVRLGYLSSDFCMHPIAYLIAELIETHDRERFEVFAYCSTTDDGSEVRRRLMSAFDLWTDVKDLGDEDAAALIRSHDVDVLIDLNGLTLGTRLQVLRWRPAPIQMTYLGYNGPIPLPELDHIVADAYVIPPERARFYRPRPLYLEGCFQANDSTLPIRTGGTRAEVGLPDDMFVFCCFSNTFKITEEVFSAWMLILTRAPRSVLWIYVDNEVAQDNLLRVASRFGVDATRLVFAQRAEPSLYRGRLALADLFLDTFPYNSGTTASDALRVGLPLVTISGETFIARMAGSLLATMGVTQGVVSSIEEYVDYAVHVAHEGRQDLKLLSARLPELWKRTIGDTASFCARFEGKILELVAKADASETSLILADVTG